MRRKIASALIATVVSVSMGVSSVPAAPAAGAGTETEITIDRTDHQNSQAPADMSGDGETETQQSSVTPGAPKEEMKPEETPEESEEYESTETPKTSQAEQPSVTPEAPEGGQQSAASETEQQPEGNQMPESDLEQTPESVQNGEVNDQVQVPLVMAQVQQWQQENGIWYYYNADGERVTGWLEEGGNLYYLNPDGSMVTGWQQIDGKWYYFRSWGAAYRNAIFTDPADGNIYYGLSDGSIAKNTWIQIGGKWYYFRSWGAAYRNEKFTDPADGNIYYGLSDGAMATNQWIQISGKWYYFRSWGAAYRDEIFTDSADGNIYYGLSDGSMATNTWVTKESKKYYFRSWGAAYRNEKFTDPADGNIYYGSADGSVVTNQWVQIGSDQYCFDGQGKAYRNQWFDSSKNPTGSEPAVGFYYVGSNGVMLKDTYFMAQKDGGDYYYSFSGNGDCNYADPQYVRIKDSVNGLYYVVEHQYYTDPQVSDRDLMAAICVAEAGIQRTTGMTAVAMVIRNRMDEYGYSLKTAIYRQQQFEPARNGSLTKYLQGISNGTSSIMQELTNTGAYIAADTSETIMNDYKTNGTKRVVPGFGDTREDFDYMYFMTPAAFERLNLDPEKCQTYIYTYQGTTSTGGTYTSSHIFFVNWVRKS